MWLFDDYFEKVFNLLSCLVKCIVLNGCRDCFCTEKFGVMINRCIFATLTELDMDSGNRIVSVCW